MRTALARILSSAFLAASSVVFLHTAEVRAVEPSPFDTSFGTNGMLVTGIPLQKSESIASDVISDTTGNLYVLYQASGGNSGGLSSVGKLTSDGTPISQFGTNGRTSMLNLSGANFALQNDEKIIVAGFSSSNGRSKIVVQRFTATGTTDTTFGTNGAFELPEFPGKAFTSSEVLIVVSDTSERIYLGFNVMNTAGDNANFYFVAINFSGALDTSWGNSAGREVVPRVGGASAYSTLTGLKLLNDGSLLGIGSAFGTYTRQIVLTKINVNGYLDSTFDGASNGNGIVFVQFASETDAYMTAAAVLQNDDVVVAGIAGTYYSGPWYYGIAKILSDGTVDTTFGSSGFKLSSLSSTYDIPLPKRLGVQSDGRYVFPINSGTTGGFMRVETNGTFSNTPNCSQCLWSGANSGARAISLFVQSSDKVVVVGDLRTEKNSIVRRFVANGSTDGTFSNVVLQLNLEKWQSYIIGSKQQPDGSIISGGAVFINNGGNEITKGVIFKFTSSGTLDPSFGLGGYQILSGPSDFDWMYTVDFVVQTDGKILLLANGEISGQSQSIYLWRLNADGSSDNTFGTNGLTVTSDGSSQLLTGPILLTNDGKIVLPISRSVNYSGTLWLYRYTSGGVLDSSFTDAENFPGGIKPNIGDGTGNWHTSTVGPNGSMYITGSTTVNGQVSTFISRFTSSGSLDSSFSGGYVSWPSNGPTLPDEIRRVVIDDQLRIVAIGKNYSQNSSNVILRLTTSGSFDTSFNSTGYRNFNFRDLSQIDGNDFSDIVISNNKYTIVGGGDSDRQQNSTVTFSGLARLSLNGEFDSSLDSDGIMLPFSNAQTYFDDAQLLSDNSILISGATKVGENFEMFFAKLLPPGAAPTTSTTTPPTTAPSSTTTTVPGVSAESKDIRLVISVSQAAVLQRLQLTVPKGGKVLMTTRTPKVCKVVKTKVTATSTGTCRITVTITVKKKKTSKTLALKVS
jgi:uncharacterized delta-60 repeat protein